ncbi:hypothetical protein [Bradyrhizobium ottawaense]|uniref:hypothetical protein n=1 Tax=Bradyrhizobium ottawaense TaxID=931866 RepID=UPI003399E8A8
MKSGKRAIVIAARLFAAATIGHPSRADDNNARTVTQSRPIVVIESAFCIQPNVKDGTPCNPPYPTDGCPGHCISGQCIKQILE